MEKKEMTEVGSKEVAVDEVKVEEKSEGGKKKRSIREFLRRAIKSDDTPGQIALGMGIGVLMAFSPLAGTQTISALGLSFILRANKLSALAGTFFANPFTMPIFYFCELKLGKAILGYSLEIPENVVSDFNGLMSLGSEVMLSLAVGFLLVGTITAAVAYFVTLRSVFTFRKMRGDGEKTDI